MTLALKQSQRKMLGYRETQVLDYVRASIAQDGQAPTYEMIRDELALSTKGKVCEIVKRLERRKLLVLAESNNYWDNGTRVRRIGSVAT